MVRSSEINQYQADCHGWNSYDYRAADLREMPLTHLGGRNYPGSKSRACEDVKVVNLIYVQEMFYENDSCM